MKSLLLVFNFLLVVMQCSSEMAAPKSEIWWINSSKVACTGVGPMQCLQIQKSETIEEGKWELFYDQIEGFTYEPGFIYQLEVETSKKLGPIPADASSLSYKLIQLVSKKQDPKLALTNTWKLEHVGAIRGPKSAKGEALVYEFDASQGTFFGPTDCNSIRGGFTLHGENEIHFGEAATTMMACPSMEVELELKKVLKLIRTFEIENNVLYLRNEAGQILMSLRGSY